MRNDYIEGMPTWEASAREREQVLRAYARRKAAQQDSIVRIRALLFGLALLVALVLLMPSVVEIAVGAGMLAMGLLWLLLVLAGRHLQHPLLDGLIAGGLLGWLVGRRRR